MQNYISELPFLDDTRNPSSEDVLSFKENGHILIPALLNKEEVHAWRPVIEQAARAYNTETRELNNRDTYGKAFLQIMNLWKASVEMERFVCARRFAHVAAALLETPNVRLYHDQALFKEPGGGPTPWHQDQFYWPLDTPKTVTLWLPLQDTTQEMGMLTFASGSHTRGNVLDKEISDESEDQYSRYVLESGFNTSRAFEMKAGDSSWHYGYTIHNAPGNTSMQMREVMTIIYYADGAKVTPPANRFQEKDRQRWLAGKSPGEPADSILNPLLL